MTNPEVDHLNYLMGQFQITKDHNWFDLARIYWWYEMSLPNKLKTSSMMTHAQKYEDLKMQ